MKKCISILLAGLMMLSLIGCDSGKNEETEKVDYLVLVNKLNRLPEDWEDTIEIVHSSNSMGDDVETEKKAYEAYLALKEDLEKDGVYIDLDSAYRSVAVQQRIMDDFTEKYGAEYAAKTVAVPGYSEHHTGLALDLYLNVDGEDIIYNEDLVQYPEIWAKIHEKLDDHGFILRYLPDKEHITGYAYEPWHIRYVDSVEIAREITEKGITLESYLAGREEGDVAIDVGSSEVFTSRELEDALIQIKCAFAKFDGCVLKAIRYAGDDAVDHELMEGLNADGGTYTWAANFLMDYTGADGSEIIDYPWLLARNSDGEWEIIAHGE